MGPSLLVTPYVLAVKEGGGHHPWSTVPSPSVAARPWGHQTERMEFSEPTRSSHLWLLSRDLVSQEHRGQGSGGSVPGRRTAVDIVERNIGKGRRRDHRTPARTTSRITTTAPTAPTALRTTIAALSRARNLSAWAFIGGGGLFTQGAKVFFALL